MFCRDSEEPELVHSSPQYYSRNPKPLYTNIIENVFQFKGNVDVISRDISFKGTCPIHNSFLQTFAGGKIIKISCLSKWIISINCF